jgi:hypothetical protein
MTTHEQRSERIQDYLDGLLSPAAAAEVEELIRTDSAWRRDHAELSSTMTLLGHSLDVEPPPGLLAGALARLAEAQAATARRAQFFGLPIAVENALVFVGMSVLAVMVFLGQEFSPVGGETSLLGQAASAFTHVLGLMKTAILDLASSLTWFDWLGSVLGALFAATRFFLSSTISEMQPMVPIALALSVLGWLGLWRKQKGLREREVTHVGLFSF